MANGFRQHYPGPSDIARARPQARRAAWPRPPARRPTTGDGVAECRALAIDSLESVAVRGRRPVDPRPGDGRGQSGAPADPAGSGPADDQRGAPLRVASSGWNETFTVVYWDQRGCGRSLREQKGPGRHQPGADGQRHRRRSWDSSGTGSAQKSYVAGFSFGATIGAYAAARRPDLVEVAGGGGNGRRRCRRRARCLRLRARRPPASAATGVPIRQLEAIGPPPHLKAKQFATRVRWAANFGGVTTGETYATLSPRAAGQPGALARLLGRGRRPDRPRDQRDPGRAAGRAGQHGPGGQPAAHRRARSSWSQGRHDQVAPGAAAQRYASALQAPSKQPGVVRALGPHAASRGTRASSGTSCCEVRGQRGQPAQPDYRRSQP